MKRSQVGMKIFQLQKIIVICLEMLNHYLERIESLAETPIQIVSVGPQRDETIMIDNPFS